MQVRVALLALRGYKIFISPYFRGSCRFLPSCADYTAEAIEQHGVLAGS
jgi:putative component of membrane protein insertase Oxa1/YidC/SpoIIIJ protein YidD